MSTKIGMSIIMPAYNEEKRISSVLDKYCKFIENNDLDYELVLPIDGEDKTEDIGREYMKKFPFIVLSKSKIRNGKGGGIKRGIRLSHGNIVAFADADGSSSIEELKKLYETLIEENLDVVIGSRYMGENEIPLTRKFFSRVFNILVNGLFQLHIRDSQSGYKIFRKDKIELFLNTISVTNFFFDVDLIFKCKINGLKIKEEKIKWHYVKEGNVSVLREIVGMGISLVALRVWYSPLRKIVPKMLIEFYFKKFRWI